MEYDRAKSLTDQADKGTALFLTEAAAEYQYDWKQVQAIKKKLKKFEVLTITLHSPKTPGKSQGHSLEKRQLPQEAEGGSLRETFLQHGWKS